MPSTPPPDFISAAPRIPLTQVIATELLERRVPRMADREGENRALLALASAMANAPETVLQLLVDEARSLCFADSAGVSLLDSERPVGPTAQFRWIATSGGLGPLAGNTMPRYFSPCGTVLDANRTLLMRDPVKHYEYIDALPIPVREVLLVPFFRGEVAIGTVWVAAHSDQRKFDAEDARLVKSLSQFAAAAVQVLEASESAARRERERGEFLATLTHEMRNLLAPMASGVRIIELSKEREQRHKAREMIERQIRQLNRLVDDLLETSRISTGKLTLDLTEVDLTALVREAIDASRSRIEKSGQSISFTAPATPVRIQGDAIRLAQVLSNLLTNASKYGAAGGVVSISLRDAGDHAVLSVRDTGIGIEPAMLLRIFELFVQVDQSLTKSEGGLGIGLALVKQLVTMHGGRVIAHSAGLGKGSEFTVFLPIARV